MKNSSKTTKIFIYLCLALMAISILIPLVWVMFASIKENVEFYGTNAWRYREAYIGKILSMLGPKRTWANILLILLLLQVLL